MAVSVLVELVAFRMSLGLPAPSLQAVKIYRVPLPPWVEATTTVLALPR